MRIKYNLLYMLARSLTYPLKNFIFLLFYFSFKGLHLNKEKTYTHIIHKEIEFLNIQWYKSLVLQ